MTATTFPRSLADDRPAFVLDLAQSLASRWDVTVVAPHEPGAALRERMGDVEVLRYRYRIPGLSALTVGGGILASLRANRARAIQVPTLLASQFASLRRACADRKPALVHAHWIVPQGTVAAVAVGRTIPCLATAHGGDVWALRRGRLRGALAWTLRRLPMVTAVSKALRDAIREIAPAVEAEVAPMGVDTSLFTPLARRWDSDPWPSGRGLRLLFVGRLVEKKGLATLLTAMSTSRAEEHQLVVAGDGPLRSQLEKRANELGIGAQVRFIGAVPHRSLPALYAAADAFVGPSVTAQDGDSEGLGLVFAEALSSGTAVVASDLAAIRDLVVDGENGLVFPPGDPAALARSLRDLQSGDRRRELASRARPSIEATMSKEVVADRYDALYRRLLGT